MEPITSIKMLVSFWPTVEAFAVAVSTPDDPVPVNRVFQWMRVNRVGRKYFARIIDAAKVRGVRFTETDLIRIIETRKEHHDKDK